MRPVLKAKGSQKMSLLTSHTNSVPHFSYENWRGEEMIEKNLLTESTLLVLSLFVLVVFLGQ